MNPYSTVIALSCQAVMFAILSLGVTANTIAANYYINASEGDDAFSGQKGTVSSPTGPWKSLARLAGVSFQPGDKVLLHCASIWHEALRIHAKGSAASRITIEPYGLCVNTRPSIRPTRMLHTPIGGKEPTIELDAAPQMVIVDNQVAPRARFPANGYLFLQQVNGIWHIPLTAIPVSNTALTGADLIVRVNDYNIEERRLYGVEPSGIFTVAKPFAQTISRGAGAYLEGLPWMIAKPLNWAYDDTNQKLKIRLENDSAKIEVALPGNGIYINDSEYLTLRGLDIAYSEQNSIEINRGRNIRIEDVHAKDVGNSFIHAIDSYGLVIDGFLGLRSQRNGIVARGSAVTVTNSDLSDVGASSNIRKSIAAIELGYAADAIITNNRIRRTGYSAIMFGKRARVEGNSIIDACISLSDCGAIYTSGSKKYFGLYGASIRNNLIAGVPGNIDGNGTKTPLTAGIYLDDESAGIAVENNHIERAQRGIFSKAHSSRIVGNTLISNDRSIFLTNAGARGGEREDRTELRANKIVSMGEQAPVLIVATSADLPLASTDNEQFWLLVGTKRVESWLGTQRLVAEVDQLSQNSTSIKRISHALSIVNPEAATVKAACPRAANCLQTRLLSGDAANWPMAIAPNSALVVVIPK